MITGASSGIDESFAHALAARRMILILVARSEERLHTLADELSRHYGIKAVIIATDLSQSCAAKRVKDAVRERDLAVHLLDNNAGFAVYDHFEKIDPELDHQQVMVNVSAVVDMAHAFLPDMVARGEGAVITVSSRGAFQPGASFAVYAESKALSSLLVRHSGPNIERAVWTSWLFVLGRSIPTFSRSLVGSGVDWRQRQLLRALLR